MTLILTPLSMGAVCPHGESLPPSVFQWYRLFKIHLSPIMLCCGSMKYIKMPFYENTEELFGDFEENDYLCIRYLTY